MRLLDGRLVVEAVDLVEVDVIHAEPPQRRVDAVEEMLARQALVVRTVAHRQADLRGDDDLVALRELLQRAPGDLFADAARVHVRGVEEVDAALERAFDERPARRFVERPRMPLRRSVRHHAEADAGDFEPCRTESDVIHRVKSLQRSVGAVLLASWLASATAYHEDTEKDARSARGRDDLRDFVTSWFIREQISRPPARACRCARSNPSRGARPPLSAAETSRESLA